MLPTSTFAQKSCLMPYQNGNSWVFGSISSISYGYLGGILPLTVKYPWTVAFDTQQNGQGMFVECLQQKIHTDIEQWATPSFNDLFFEFPPPQKEDSQIWLSQPPFFRGILAVSFIHGQELRTEDEKKGAELVFKSLQALR